MIKKVLEFAQNAIGAKYSQEERMRAGTFDCSSLVYRAYRDAGYTYQTTNTSSTALVYDKAFECIWPTTQDGIGKSMTSIAEQKQKGYRPTAGDVVYFCTDSHTNRKNKITHVALIENEKNIIHARGKAYGVRRDPIDLYGKKVVAITRFRQSQSNSMPCFATCKGVGVNIRTTPSLNGQIIAQAKKNEPLLAMVQNEEWARIVCMQHDKVYSGYMHRDYVDIQGEKS